MRSRDCAAPWYMYIHVHGCKLQARVDRNVTFLGVLLYLRNIHCTGLAINEIELEKIADHFDRDHDGFIDLNEIISILGCNYRERSLDGQ